MFSLCADTFKFLVVEASTSYTCCAYILLLWCAKYVCPLASADYLRIAQPVISALQLWVAASLRLLVNRSALLLVITGCVSATPMAYIDFRSIAFRFIGLQIRSSPDNLVGGYKSHMLLFDFNCIWCDKTWKVGLKHAIVQCQPINWACTCVSPSHVHWGSVERPVIICCSRAARNLFTFFKCNIPAPSFFHFSSSFNV